ncbi:CBS domain-containing protein, partial [Bradyrhizobium uaiense]|uniref:CBS domain-containing protein n=1 Tax=Bradyrhizobium uaiense TaxID=2594946 RepID=UPI003221CF6E
MDDAAPDDDTESQRAPGVPLDLVEDTPPDLVVELMEKNNVKRLPVVRGGKLVGIITRSNLLRTVARLARDIP